MLRSAAQLVGELRTKNSSGPALSHGRVSLVRETYRATLPVMVDSNMDLLASIANRRQNAQGFAKSGLLLTPKRGAVDKSSHPNVDSQNDNQQNECSTISERMGLVIGHINVGPNNVCQIA